MACRFFVCDVDVRQFCAESFIVGQRHHPAFVVVFDEGVYFVAQQCDEGQLHALAELPDCVLFVAVFGHTENQVFRLQFAFDYFVSDCEVYSAVFVFIGEELHQGTVTVYGI